MFCTTLSIFILITDLHEGASEISHKFFFYLKKKVEKVNLFEKDSRFPFAPKSATKKGFYSIIDRTIKAGSKLAIKISENI